MKSDTVSNVTHVNVPITTLLEQIQHSHTQFNHAGKIFLRFSPYLKIGEI